MEEHETRGFLLALLEVVKGNTVVSDVWLGLSACV